MTQPETQYAHLVSYDLMDPFKRAAQEAGRKTIQNIINKGFTEEEGIRGESAYIVRGPVGYLGFVVEGLGTKNLVADGLRHELNVASELGADRTNPEVTAQLRGYYHSIGWSNAATVFNDMASSGLAPLIYGQHIAVGDSEWFRDELRWQGIIDGTVDACNSVGAVWGCGETPTLRDIILPNAAELSGASVGICQQPIRCKIKPGYRILLLGSSGPHDNGFTMFRKISNALPQGYRTEMPNSHSFGEALLQPTVMYSPLIQELSGLQYVSYAVNITGHGWRKLMRAEEPFVYVIERLPSVHTIFKFVQDHLQETDHEMYANYNMGAGFALFVAPEHSAYVRRIAREMGYQCLDAGYVEKYGNDKRVEIRPLNIVFEGEELAVR